MSDNNNDVMYEEYMGMILTYFNLYQSLFSESQEIWKRRASRGGDEISEDGPVIQEY